jgi:alpha-1,2-mannosyltransferase
VACPFTITFGSTFLNLTTGQNGLFVLLGVVLLSRHLSRPRTRSFVAVVGWVIAVAAKIYPLLWLAAWPFLRKRLALAMALTVVAVFAIILLVEPAANKDYWFRFLPESAESYGGGVRVDDQSLGARVALIGRTSQLGFSGKDVETRHEKAWRPPREIPSGVVHLITVVGLLGLGAGIVRVWLRADAARYGEGLFYLVVLYALLPVPHMERYNHVAILPAMAWLWGQDRKYRSLTVAAYCLVGLSRLNHLWALTFGWPLGPLATGTCMYAVLVLGLGIAHRVLSRSSSTC